jgi:serine/threonine protein phosphatase 1
MTSRTIAVGDIHGCADAWAALLNAVQPAAGDHLILLGDIIDRGPDSRTVIDSVIALGERCQVTVLLGNHEEMLLAARADPSPATLYPWINYGGLATLKSYGAGVGLADLPPDHVALIERCVPYYETDSHIFLHANYDPNQPLAAQSPRTLRWESLRDRIPVRHVSGKTVVLGHTPQKESILDRGYLKCIDTHCYAGGWLTALDAHSGRIWQANQSGEVR